MIFTAQGITRNLKPGQIFKDFLEKLSRIPDVTVRVFQERISFNFT